MQCFAMTSKHARCTIERGKWYMANEGEHVFLCDQFHAKLAKVIEAAVFRTHNVESENLTDMYTNILAFGPVANRDSDVQQADYQDQLKQAHQMLKNSIRDAADQSPMAQAMITKTNTRRLASGRIVELVPNGKAMKAVINHGDKPKGTPRIVGPRTRKLASGKIVNVDSNGKVIW